MHFFKSFSFSLAMAMAVNAAKIYHCTEPNTIALTFDDGPNDETTPILLDLLKKHGIHATFFINGDNYIGNLEKNEVGQALIRREHEEGHQIASHTWRHQIPATKKEIKEDMDRLDNLIEKNAGYRPKYFRAPCGDISTDTIEYFESLGYRVIQWDTDTNDWDYTNFNLDEEHSRLKRVEMVKDFFTSEWEKSHENYLILMHDVQSHTVESIVPWVVNNYPKDKYKFVTVAECLGDYNEGKNKSYNKNGNHSSDKDHDHDHDHDEDKDHDNSDDKKKENKDKNRLNVPSNSNIVDGNDVTSNIKNENNQKDDKNGAIKTTISISALGIILISSLLMI